MSITSILSIRLDCFTTIPVLKFQSISITSCFTTIPVHRFQSIFYEGLNSIESQDSELNMSTTNSLLRRVDFGRKFNDKHIVIK